MKEEKTAKEETQVKGIVLPAGVVGMFCVVSIVLCVDFIEQTIRYTQEEASLLTIVRKTLAAAGWGVIAVSVAVRLWNHCKALKKNA